MPKVIYIEKNGTRHEVEVPVGTSLMQSAINNMIPGIEGDCGGLCACATCHVYVREPWKQQCSEQEELETNILDFAYDVDEDSRLSCQIKMTEELDGIEIHLPDRQY